MRDTIYQDTSSTVGGRRQGKPLRYRLAAIANVLPRAILRSPLHGLMSGGFVLLGFTGRVSGKTYLVPVAFLENDGALLIGTDRPWRKNMRTGDTINVWLRGRRERASVEVFTGEADVARWFGIIIPQNPVLPRFLGLRLDPDGTVSRDDLQRGIARGLAAIRLTLV